MFFPKEIFSHILEYCDDRVEQDQKRIWDHITMSIAPHDEYYTDFYIELGDGDQERIKFGAGGIYGPYHYWLDTQYYPLPTTITETEKLEIIARNGWEDEVTIDW